MIKKLAYKVLAAKFWLLFGSSIRKKANILVTKWSMLHLLKGGAEHVQNR